MGTVQCAVRAIPREETSQSQDGERLRARSEKENPLPSSPPPPFDYLLYFTIGKSKLEVDGIRKAGLWGDCNHAIEPSRTQSMEGKDQRGRMRK